MKTVYREKRYYCGEYLDVYRLFTGRDRYRALVLAQ